MLIRTQAPVAEISGKQGEDIVFFSWRGTQCARDYARPSNPNTPRQQAFRSTLAAITKRWQALSDAQREAWATYSALAKVKNRLGSMVTSTPLSCYVQTNSIPFTAYGTFIDSPPSPSAPAAPYNITSATVNGDNRLTIGFTKMQTPVAGKVVVYLFKPASPAIRLSEDAMRIATYPASNSLFATTAAATTGTAQIDASNMPYPVSEDTLLHIGLRILMPDGSISSMKLQKVIVQTA